MKDAFDNVNGLFQAAVCAVGRMHQRRQHRRRKSNLPSSQRRWHHPADNYSSAFALVRAVGLRIEFQFDFLFFHSPRILVLLIFILPLSVLHVE